jgi:nitroreductase
MSTPKLEPIKLNPPQLDKGKTVMQALQDRSSQREFSEQRLSLQHLSEVLWAANGVNRPDGKRTAPSAMNKHPIDVYAVLREGVYLYDPQQHSLLPRVQGDWRKDTGWQEFAAIAPLNLVYVADMSKFSDAPFQMDETLKWTWVCLDAGHNAENVSLYCASEGLAVVPRAAVDSDKLAAAMQLGSEHKIVLTQTVGHFVR